MKSTVERFAARFIPFASLGVGIVLIIALFILFFYIFVWGVLLGALIWLVVTLKNHFFPNTMKTQKPHRGRVIEHEKE